MRLKARRKAKKELARKAQRIRKLMVHHAGCVLCTDTHEMGRSLAEDAKLAKISVRVPKRYR